MIPKVKLIRKDGKEVDAIVCDAEFDILVRLIQSWGVDVEFEDEELV